MGDVEEEDLLSRRQFPSTLDGSSLEALLTLYQLQKVCHSRTFQHWEVSQIMLGTQVLLYFDHITMKKHFYSYSAQMKLFVCFLMLNN